ncbi:hypothetical protein KSP40_PGU003387 [Platanthera guangdongensis]|uniref:Dipeptide epimerase n=1 Tax=Platanthera guangdongensis TaxID=2320717 RepID=A0ABR2MNF9_9ASPA
MNCRSCPIASLFHSSLKNHRRRRASAGAASSAKMSAGGFDALKATFSVEVIRAEGRPLNVPLIAPFTIASSHLDEVGNVAVRLELRDGCVGWGEAPVLPSVTAEDQPAALEAAALACRFLLDSPPMALGSLLAEIAGFLPGHDFASVSSIRFVKIIVMVKTLTILKSQTLAQAEEPPVVAQLLPLIDENVPKIQKMPVRAGIEMALVDAAANSLQIPLWKLFGGASTSIVTDITIPIVTPDEAAKLAVKYKERGFKTLKLKVGKNLGSDIEVLRAIRLVHPDCSFILDANEGYTASEAIEVLEKLNGKYGVSVAADESCRSLEDAKRIIEGNLAHVINIKLAKLGVLGALDVIEASRSAGIELMIGGMVETRLAMGFAAHLAAGFGFFKYIDLDTPLLLLDDPVIGGYEVSGAVYKFNHSSGQGVSLDWDNIS